MEPKKKSSLGIIIGAISLAFAVYFGAEAGMAWSEAAGDGGTVNDLSVFLKYLTDRLNGDLFANFFWNDFVLKGIGIALFVWFLILLMLNSNRRNFIRGKEYGTAKWGSNKDIKDLFAKNIEAEQLKDAKKVKYAITRFLLKRQLKKRYKKQKAQLHNMTVTQLDNRFKMEILDAKNKDVDSKAIKNLKERQAAEKKDRMKSLADEEKNLWREMWEPAQIDYDYKSRVEEIEALSNQGLSITPATKQAELEKAAEARDKAMQKFLDVERKQLKIKAKYLDADCILTHTERTSIYNYKINNNVLIMGGAGAGKSRGFVVPNLLQAHSSYVVTDPKGEVLEKTGHFLQEQGYKIKVLNLDEKSESDCYNPFVYIHPERAGYEERILSLINTLIKATTKDKGSGGQDPFWENAERLFLQAVFFFTVDGFCPEQRNMNTVMELIAKLEIAEQQDNKHSELDLFAARFEEKLNEKDTVNHNAGTLNNGVKAWKEFRSKASGKTAKSIVITAVARLAPFRTSGIRRIMQYDDMELERLGEEKMVVFIVVPPTDDTFNFIAAMMFTQMFQELQYCATQVHKHEGQRLPIPVRFILDEFANTCAVPEFEKILAYARSFGIGIVPILQSLDQLKALYKDTWRTIIDNCSAMLYLGSISSDETLKYISDLLGKGTFDKRTTGRSRGRNGSSSENFDVIGRELMTPDEIRRMDKSKCLLIISGRYPFYSDKYDMTEHKNYYFTSDGNHDYSYHHEKSSHREKILIAEKIQADERKSATEAAKSRAAETVAQVDKEVESIQLDADAKSVLRFMTSRIEHLQPVVMRGENDESMAQAIHDCLTDMRSAQDAMMDMILDSSDSEKPPEPKPPEVQEVVQEAEKAAEKITIDTKPSEIAKHLLNVKSIRSISIVDTTVKENDAPQEAEVEAVLESSPETPETPTASEQVTDTESVSEADTAEAKEVMRDQNIDDLSLLLGDLDMDNLRDISESGD